MAQTTSTPYRDGPIIVRGPIKLTDPEGNLVETRRKTVALCRCGESGIKPFCDGTHKGIGFTAPGRDGRAVALGVPEVPAGE